MHRWLGLALLGCVLAPKVAHAGAGHVELIAKTPCLYEYRLWALDARRSAAFSRPSEYSAEQCDLAARLHDEIQQQQAAEAAAELAQESAQRDAAAADRQRQALQAVMTYEQHTAERQRQQAAAQAALAAEEEALRKRAEEERAAAAAQARRPPPRIGMTAKQVRAGSSWGVPDRVYRTITATGVREQWVYGRSALFFDNDVLYSIHTLTEQR